jgi:hypothetical protein
VYDWLKNPYCESSVQRENFTLREEEELCELQSDHALKIQFTDRPIRGQVLDFCERRVCCHSQESNIHIAAVFDFLHVWTSFFFFCLRSNKSKDRNRLIAVEDELHVCLCNVRPRIKYLCRKKQAQVSH